MEEHSSHDSRAGSCRRLGVVVRVTVAVVVVVRVAVVAAVGVAVTVAVAVVERVYAHHVHEETEDGHEKQPLVFYLEIKVYLT